MKSIGIIGAGLMGRLIALTLHRQGYQVTLFDKDTKAAKNSAAYAAAGLLTPLGEAPHSERNIVEMGFESLKLWPTILDSLEEYTFFQQQGSILVSHEQDQGDYQRFDRYIKRYYPVSENTKFTIQNLNRQQLLALEPELGRSFKQGIYLPEEGQIGNRKLLLALKYQLEKENITWLSETQINEILPNDNGCLVKYRHYVNQTTANNLIFTQTITSNSSNAEQEQQFDQIIDCRGIGAKEKMAGKENAHLSDLRAVRGEMFQLLAPDVQLSRPIRLMHPRYQLYIAPKGKGFYAVGATQIESDDASPMTVRSAMELLSAAYSVHSGFAEANIRQHISQLRPAFNDNQPHILAHDSLIQVNGLYRHGFLIAPVVLAQVIELIANINSHKGIDRECQYSQWLPITYQQTAVTAC